MRNRSVLLPRNLGRQLCTGIAALLLSQAALAQYRFEFLDMLAPYSTSTAGRVTNNGQMLGAGLALILLAARHHRDATTKLATPI